MLRPRMALVCIFWVPTVLTTLGFTFFSFYIRIDLDRFFGFGSSETGYFARSGSCARPTSVGSTSSPSVTDMASSSSSDSNLTSNSASTTCSCLYPVAGRYSLVRTHLGLDGRPISPISIPSHQKERIIAFDILTFPFFSLTAKRDTSPSFQKSSKPQTKPTRWKRSLDFVLHEQSSMSESDSTGSSSGPSGSVDSKSSDLRWQGESTVLKLTEDSSWDYSLNKQQVLDSFASAAHRDEEDAALAALARLKKTKARERQREREGQRELSRKKKDRRKTHT